MLSMPASLDSRGAKCGQTSRARREMGGSFRTGVSATLAAAMSAGRRASMPSARSPSTAAVKPLHAPGSQALLEQVGG